MTIAKKYFPLTVLLGIGIAGCSGGGGMAAIPTAGNVGESQPDTNPPPPPDPIHSELKICSKLDFANLDWPSSMGVAEHDPFALALNISGSFEGNDGWENLTNNFDGQGLSLGLL